jgi:hypothetical protein
MRTDLEYHSAFLTGLDYKPVEMSVPSGLTSQDLGVLPGKAWPVKQRECIHIDGCSGISVRYAG